MLGQHRSTQRHVPKGQDDEARLVSDMTELARQYGRYGYRRIAALLRDAGWQVNDKRVERLWRRPLLCSPPARRAESSIKTTEEVSPVAQRWIVRPAPGSAPEPCLVL